MNKFSINAAQAKNSNYFNYYSNGGYGKLPNPSYDDMTTTDEYVARRIAYPTIKSKEYYTSYDSPNNVYTKNRMKTLGESISSIQSKGIEVVGQDNFGKYSLYATVPDSSGYIKTYSAQDDYNQFLWILFGVGFLAFMVNAMTP